MTSRAKIITLHEGYELKDDIKYGCLELKLENG